MSARDEGIPQPLARLLGPTENEVSCETCFARLDEYVELERSGADAEASIPGFAAHLSGCPACREEHQSLHALLATEESGGSAV
jgi:hypothetical protein